jgi:cytochrome c oxidase cbb3-type subunit IV
MNMETEWMRSMMTVVAFVTFIGIVWWAWSARKKTDFDVAARSVLEDHDGDPGGRRT